MADRATFSPQELDRIEDALERLDDPEWDLDAAFEYESSAVRECLLDYREILIASREALPLEDPPAEVLAEVLARAREAADAPVLGVSAVPDEAPRSWWQRLRGMLLIPGVAVAATAVLVLVIVQPTADKADPPASATPIHVEAELAVEAEPAREVTAVAPAEEADKHELAEEPAEAEVPLREVATSRRPGSPPIDATVPSASPVGGAVAVPQGSAQQAKNAADPQLTPRWDLIARGDRARRDGDCKRARDEYTAALGDADTRVRARAEAGIGLCDMAEGAYTKAQDHYDRARELDEAIVGFIEDERPQGSLGGAGKASKAKRSKAGPATGAKKTFDDALE